MEKTYNWNKLTITRSDPRIRAHSQRKRQDESKKKPDAISSFITDGLYHKEGLTVRDGMI